MSLIITLKSELLKTKRSPIWLLTAAMSIFIPTLQVFIFKEELDEQTPAKIAAITKAPWDYYFAQVTAIASIVFMPMYLVLTSALLPQIEYRNHTWKQVFASPQSYGKLYFSKFVVFQLFLLSFLVFHILFTLLSGVISGFLYPKFQFFTHGMDWVKILSAVGKTYVSVFAMSALQFWLGVRFKSFVVAIGIGVLFWILGMFNMLARPVIDPDKYFFNFSAYITIKNNASMISTVLTNSLIYGAVLLTLGFWNFSTQKER